MVTTSTVSIVSMESPSTYWPCSVRFTFAAEGSASTNVQYVEWKAGAVTPDPICEGHATLSDGGACVCAGAPEMTELYYVNEAENKWNCRVPEVDLVCEGHAQLFVGVCVCDGLESHTELYSVDALLNKWDC